MMQTDTEVRRTNVFIAMLALVICVMITACASPPPAPAVVVPTKFERTVAALKAMLFEQADDGWRLTLPAPLVFAFDSDVVAPTARESLMRVGRELTELGIERALVRGHTDNVGTQEYNLGLSKRRADAVSKVLADGGFSAERIDSKGMGTSMPAADNASAEGRAINRRVVIIVQVI